jgi:hypothetical protein
MVALCNLGTVEDVPVLLQALDDPEFHVREHAAWALDRLTRHIAPTTWWTCLAPVAPAAG